MSQPSPAGDDQRADLRWGTIPRLVEDVANRWPASVAVGDSRRQLTFPELAAAAADVSRGLMAQGVEAGDRVAIWAPNSIEWVVAALGVVGAGGILVTINTRFKGAEAAYVLQSAGVKVLMTVERFLDVDYPAMLAGHDIWPLELVVLLDGAPRPAGVAAVAGHGNTGVAAWTWQQLAERAGKVSEAEVARRARSVQPDDIGDLLFTSGTTGRPKGVPSTHAQSLRTFGAWSSIVGLRAGDRYLVVNPFFHTFGYKAGLLASLMTGSTVIPMPVFDVTAVLETIARERVTVLPGPPTLYQSILDSPAAPDHDLSSLRLGVTGAAVVPVELVVAMKERLGFDTVLTAYGLTESCGTVTMCRRGDPAELVATTSGRAIPGLEVRIAPPGSATAPAVHPTSERAVREQAVPDQAGPDQPGEILVRGYTVMTGYWHDPDATAEVIDDAGWLHTGDIGVMDAEGNVTVTDRLKDMYVVGGFNAYPAEIEAVLRQCPGVGRVAVVGVPDERLGEVGCAFVVPERPGGAGSDLAAEVRSWARANMANYKAPRYVELLDELPTNAGGKVLKAELRRRRVAPIAGPHPASQREEGS